MTINKEQFQQYAAIDRMVSDMKQTASADPEALRGMAAVFVAASATQALTKEDARSIFEEEWERWTEYRAVRTMLEKRRAEQKK